MKAKLTPEAAQAITSLRTNRDWAEVLNWMANTAGGWNQACVMADEPDKRAVAAGMSRGWALFAEAIDTAPQVLEGMKRDG